jgi:hypothetical protein
LRKADNREPHLKLVKSDTYRDGVPKEQRIAEIKSLAKFFYTDVARDMPPSIPSRKT